MPSQDSVLAALVRLAVIVALVVTMWLALTQGWLVSATQAAADWYVGTVVPLVTVHDDVLVSPSPSPSPTPSPTPSVGSTVTPSPDPSAG